LSKCAFAQQQIAYLGHIISCQGVATDPSKVEAVQNWPVPQNCKELRGFLGLAGYYRKFVRHFGLIAKPLTNLLKKGVLFVWTHDHEVAFDTLKQSLSSAPVLALPNFAMPFAIESDASSSGIGAVLLQDGHPLAFVSKALGSKTKGLSTYEKEYLAIILAVTQWRQYLQHSEFLIYTDHRSLSHLTEQKLHTPWQQKMFSKLLGLQYRVVYKKGVENGAADALSRRPATEAVLCSVSSSVPQWLIKVSDSYNQDPQAQKLLTELVVQQDNSVPYSVHSGIIRYKGRVWVGNDFQLQHKIIAALHDSPLGGHSGFPVTYRRVKQLFSWKGMKDQIKCYVAGCSVCQQSKPDRSKYPGLLQPIPVPEQSWQVISMDFVEGLPRSRNADTILVVVDVFSKYAHFLPLLHPYTALKVAHVFMDSVYKLHGLPHSIISDRDKIFTSHFWQELFRLSGTTLKMSSSYHPQTDGQTERVNQCLETFLRSFVHACPSKWLSWLALAEYWYNTSFHSSLGTTPFEVMYGRHPRHLGISMADVSTTNDLHAWMQDRELMVRLIRQHLLRAQQRIKTQADKGRTDREFHVGDSVYLKLQPYVQSSVARRANHKLSFKYFGPYTVLQRIGKAAYKLLLPPSAAIHPIFHVSQLKQSLGPNQVVAVLPDQIEPLQVPQQILDRRLINRGNRQVSQVLIKWSNLDASLSTWEDEVALRARFPSAAAWGQAAFQGGGNVSNPETQEQTSAEEATTAEPERRMGRRSRRPSSKIAGAEWIR
jgi:transposase InsO family protein